MDGGDTSLSNFMRGRQPQTGEGSQGIADGGKTGVEESIRRSRQRMATCVAFVRQVYVEIYDFECGQRLERQAEIDIRSHIAANPDRHGEFGKKLEHFFARVDQRGVRVTSSSLRQVLAADEIKLKSSPDYAEDIARLQELTARNLDRLKEHSTLPFGPNPGDAVHIPRTEELHRPGGSCEIRPFLDHWRTGLRKERTGLFARRGVAERSLSRRAAAGRGP